MGDIKYRLKLDGDYVVEKDYRYLVDCSREESIFKETIAKSIKKTLGDKVELKVIEDDKKY